MCLGVVCSFGLQAEVSLDDLTKLPTYSQVKLSPNGKYFAVRMLIEEKYTLAVLGAKALEVKGLMAFPRKNQVGEYYWVNNERIVIKVLNSDSNQDAPGYYGELFAVNYDGSRGELIFGYRSGEMSTGTRRKVKDADRAWADIIHTIPDDDKHILISSTPMSIKRNRLPYVQKLDVYKGFDSNRIASARYPSSWFLADQQGLLRVIVGEDKNNKRHFHVFDPEKKNRTEVSTNNFGSDFLPIAISDDLSKLFAFDNKDQDKIGLFKFSIDGSEYSKVYVHDKVDITSVNTTVDGNAIYAFRLDNGYPSYMLFSKTYEEAKVFKRVLEKFQGLAVQVTSRTRDGKQWVIKVSSDINPGYFYLYNKEKDTYRALFKARPEINSKDLASVEPIQFKSFDDEVIHGYLTHAIKTKQQAKRMVVLVHGGPQARDYWEFNAEAQALATRGFSVLQINYRGSTGYGKRFKKMGNRKWGSDIQQDIISGTHWAIEQGYADKGRVCIMGGSFGAYSAVQSAISAPNLYACAVANAGIYDLKMMHTKGDIQYWYGGDAFLKTVIGEDDKVLEAMSPTYHIEKLKTPVFIAHGKQDIRAPFAHAKRLKKVMDKHNKKYQWFVKGREGHGFYKGENQRDYLQAAIEFINEHTQ